MTTPLNTLFNQRQFRRVGAYSHRRGLLMAVAILFFTLVTTAASATGFTSDFVIIRGNIGSTKIGPTSYYTNSAGSTGAAAFQGQNFGSYNLSNTNSDSLFVNAQANTLADNGDNVQSTQLLYRVYRTDSPNDTLVNFIPLALGFQSGNTGGSAKWQTLTNRSNLLSFANTSTPGNYTLQVYFQGTVTGANKKNIFDLNGNNGTYYTATFDVTVNGSQFIASQWNSGNTSKSTNWFLDSNWSNGIPNSNTDVTIPYVSGGTYPIITGNSGIAQAHNLSIKGRSNNTRGASLTLDGRIQLNIYGNFQDSYGAFSQISSNTALALAGQDQVFDASETLINFIIAGGGTKTLTKRINIRNSIIFSNAYGGAGILATRTDDPVSYGVNLQSTAQIGGESETGYILGVLTTTRPVAQGQPNSFGNAGLDLTASGAPGNVTLTRTSSIYTGVGTSVSIRRGFFLQPDVANSGNFDLTFHYLTADLNGISPGNLRLFSSETFDIPFINLGATLADQNAKTLTRTGIPVSLAQLFTLGDVTNPLPVTLVSFAATATAQGAALRWSTASEVNSKGFGIERQLAGGTTWQSVGYVTASNLASGSSYDYLDKTLPASATQVYYRLREEDKDGTLSYSPVAAISRAAAGADLTLSPVPLQAGPLTVSFAEAGQAGTEILVLNMQGQRMLHYTTTASADGGVNLALDNLAAGVYLVSVQVPGQAARHARFVKN